MPPPHESTEDDVDIAPPPRARTPRQLWSLTLLFEAGRPRSVPPFRVDTPTPITLGRASETGANLLPSYGGVERLVLGIADRRMSEVHAQVRWTSEGWSLEDAASKNGTRVNGVSIKRTILRPGDLVEVGRSFLLFSADGDSTKRDSADEVPIGFTTFNLKLGLQFDQVARIAPSRVVVLVQGETGTGKELVAGAIHDLSGRNGPFRAVNCGAIPRSLLESELFGFRRGAFSGANEDKTGLVRAADKGTLFLDEIGDLPLDAQAALLRVLQESEVHAIGASRPVAVDIRVVAATHRDLSNMVKQGRFREDLFARLNGFSVTLPPLRNRREDFGRLVELLVRRHGPQRASNIAFSPAAVRALHVYRWPGNIRELEKTIAAGLLLAKEYLLDVDCLAAVLRNDRSTPVADGGPGTSREILEDLLKKHRGNVTATANAMQTSRMQVHRLCRRFGIDLPRYRSPSP
jgi:transcriptional regulator of acetoin/glycerol metabolism